jgi:hypothetical protein
MSIKLMSEVWHLDLDHPHLLMLLAIASHADDTGRAFPGVAYLAWKTGYSERMVQRHLRTLENSGLITVTRFQQGGRGRATEYHLQLHNAARKPPYQPMPKGDITGHFPSLKGDISGPTHHADGVTPGRNGVVSGPNGVIAPSPHPIKAINRHPDSTYTPQVQTSKPVSPNPPPTRSQYISAIVTDYSRELGDSEHILQNVSQALRLFTRSALPEQDFAQLLHEARLRTRKSQTRPANDAMRNKMAYYFTVLRDLVSNPQPALANQKEDNS